MPKQTGPRTPEGKTKSSRNAVKHGLSSAVAVLPFENQDEFNTLVDTYIREQKPRNENEMHLAREMATARWKLDRLGKIETAVYETMVMGEDYNQDCPYAQLAKRITYRTYEPLSALLRFHSALERTYFRCNKELQTLRKQPLPPALPEIQNETPQSSEPAIQSRERERAESAPEPQKTKLQNEMPAAPPKISAIDTYRQFLAALPADPDECERFLTKEADFYDRMARKLR